MASKYGSTREIGEAIAAELSAAGHDVAVRDPSELRSLDGADAFVIGSAVYADRWLEPAHELLRDAADELAARPVWLFSSGPLGDPPLPEEAEPQGIAEALEAGAREHRVFAGKLDHSRLGRLERVVVKALRAPDGDFRDWDAIRAFGQSIAAALPATGA